MPEKAHTWTGRRPQTGLQGRRRCQVGAKSPEKAHTWTGQQPQTGQQGKRPCRVGAESPEKAHTWTGRRPQGADRAPAAGTDAAATAYGAKSGLPRRQSIPA